MAIMDYVTPGITKIDYEDNLFVLTDVGRDNTKDVQALIESRGGIVKGSVTKATNYLIYGDGEEDTTKYKKALELINDNGLGINVLSLSMFCTVSRGDGLIEFGSYQFDKGKKKLVPIQWNILCRQAGKALLFSAFGLDAKPYNEEWKDITWETCTLREWLNNEFLNTAFSNEERQRIMLTKVENADNSKYSTSGGNDTEDKVFLLSVSEVEKYLQTTIERRMAPTPYAVKMGAKREWNSHCCGWWLRSVGRGSDRTAFVDGNYDDDNGIHIDGSLVSIKRVVCPAMWVELE